MKKNKRNTKHTNKQAPKQTPAKKVKAKPQLSKKTLWTFRIASLILIPVLFFGTLETGLRVSGYGFSPEAIIKYKLDDKEVYCQNYKFGWRFFPHSISRHFDGFVFDTKKNPETYRIFVLGASAAMGVPAPTYNFAHILEGMLDEVYPDMDFEVHTVAMPAINSHVVLEIAKDCAKYKPDMFIVYMGNNEVVGPYGPGTVFTPLSPSLGMIRANIAVKATRTGQLLEQIAQSITPDGNAPKQWDGLEMFFKNPVRNDDPALDITYSHFKKNLTDICRTGLNAGAEVIVSNVCSNLKDCPPFLSLHRSDLTEQQLQTWEQIYKEAIKLQIQKETAAAIEKYCEAEQIDASFAELQYRLGECYLAIGDDEKAKEKYIAAREYDALRLRADSQINQVINDVADSIKDDRLQFVDNVAAMDAASENHIPGEDFFYEHVHMKFEGNYLIARNLLPYIQQKLDVAAPANTEQLCTAKKAAEYIGYTDYERVVYLSIVNDSFFKRAPFTTQLNHEETLAKTQLAIKTQLANLQRKGLSSPLATHQKAVQNRPEDWMVLFEYSAFMNSAMHDAKAEEAALRKALKLCPYHTAYLNLGANLHLQGRINESEAILKELIEINPNALRGYTELASIYIQRNEYEKAIKLLHKALILEPATLISIHIELAGAYDKSGNHQKAIDTLKNAIAIFPEEETALAHLILAYYMHNIGNYTESLLQAQKAATIDPEIKNDPSYNTLMQNLKGIKK